MLGELIPIDIYVELYYVVLLVIVLLTYIHIRVLGIDHSKNLSYIRRANVVMLFFLLLYIGLRPLSGKFVDMTAYARMFLAVQNGENIDFRDALYALCVKIISIFSSLDMFFVVLAAAYILPLYFVSKKWFKEYAFYGFLLFVISFSFFAYGTNTMRSGLGGSLFILALSKDKKWVKYLFFILSVGMHQSFLLPVAVYIIITRINLKPQVSFVVWISTLFTSWLLGGFFNDMMLNIEFLQDRTMSYLEEDSVIIDQYTVGFRWDFVIYSGFAVFWGWYFLLKRKIKDNFYSVLYSLYLICNAFWVLLIRVPFSDRFAYLSWFLMPLIIIYPLFKFDFKRNRGILIGRTILCVFIFTYFMSVIR